MNEIITGYQWSPVSMLYIGIYQFPNNLDQEKVHMPPWTTLTAPPKFDAKTQIPRWDGTSWDVIDNPNCPSHPEIKDYSILMPEYIDDLKRMGLWTAEDDKKHQEAQKGTANQAAADAQAPQEEEKTSAD